VQLTYNQAEFKSLMTSNLKLYLSSIGLASEIRLARNDTLRNCHNASLCQTLLKTGVSFVETMYKIYPVLKQNTADDEFVKERPDFYLGRFLSMFADQIARTKAELDCRCPFYQTVY
jgi:hypothetical protein